MSEFKYGDMVQVRDGEGAIWEPPRFYLLGIPMPNGGMMHYTMGYGEDESNFCGRPVCWRYARKLTLEERLERIERALAGLGPHPQD